MFQGKHSKKKVTALVQTFRYGLCHAEDNSTFFCESASMFVFQYPNFYDRLHKFLFYTRIQSLPATGPAELPLLLICGR